MSLFSIQDSLIMVFFTKNGDLLLLFCWRCCVKVFLSGDMYFNNGALDAAGQSSKSVDSGAL